MKKWWFSIAMWLLSIILLVYVIIAINLFEEETLFYTLILLSCMTPVMLMTIIGFANMPRKEKNYDRQS